MVSRLFGCARNRQPFLQVQELGRQASVIQLEHVTNALCSRFIRSKMCQVESESVYARSGVPCLPPSHVAVSIPLAFFYNTIDYFSPFTSSCEDRHRVPVMRSRMVGWTCNSLNTQTPAIMRQVSHYRVQQFGRGDPGRPVSFHARISAKGHRSRASAGDTQASDPSDRRGRRTLYCFSSHHY